MILYTLFVQRKSDYPGEFAPEAIEICDEHTMDENPEWMEEKIKEAIEYDEFSSHAIIKIEISQEGMSAIDNILNGNTIVSGTITQEI